jgi:septal ring-binding cell division protein DamX
MRPAEIYKSKIFWALLVPVLLVGLYALLGFKVAPGIVRDQAQAFVRENYGRELQIGAVQIHPFKLQLDVRDLSLPDVDGETMVGFDRLFVDFELSSLWERAFVFKDITVDAPVVRAVVRADGALNLADLALPEDPQAEVEPPPSLWIQSLAVGQGLIQFVDNARATPFERTFRDVGFALEDFRTTPEGGDFRFRANTRSDESFEWKGRFALAPLILSEGEFKVVGLQAPGVAEFLGEALPFGLTSGSIDLAGTYHVTLGEPLSLEVQLPRIDLTGLALRARGESEDWVKIPSIGVADTSLSLLGQSVTVGTITVADLTTQAWLSPDGSVNLQRLFAPAAQPAAPASPATDREPTDGASATADMSSTDEPSAQPWTVTVSSIAIDRAAIDFEDRSTEPTKKFSIAPVSARVGEASLDLARPLPVTLTATINDHASFEASGTLTPDPLAAELDVKLAKARMQILQPYILPLADLTITGGELDVAGKARLDPPGRDRPEIQFEGEVSIGDFKSVDNALEQDLVNFRRLQLKKLSFAMGPDALSIDQVLVTQPYARVIISEQQIVNIAAVLDPAGTAAILEERRADAARSPAEKRRIAKEAEAAKKAAEKARRSGTAKPAPAPATTPASESMPIRVRQVRIDGGRMNFSDYFVQPNFSAEVQDLEGTITGISSAANARAAVDLAGSVGEFSPVAIKGELQPFAFDRYTDMGLRFENIELPIFNPYSGPIAGFNIAKGKLTTDLHYLIQERKLDAQHEIRVDQLEWGEATETQGEATLPVKFATSLLKDKDGVIKLDVPVGGTLDDPTFRIGPIVWQVIKNIIVKAVTAPFALLGSLFEGAEDAQFVDFAPGEATLDPAIGERLAALSRSLVEKPELNLDIPIGTVPEIDKPRLVERAYEDAVTAATGVVLGGRRKDGESVPAFDQLEPKQQIAVLSTLVKQQTGAEPQIPEPPEPPEGTSRAEAKALRQAAKIEFLEGKAREGIMVPETELERLAEARAGAIEGALLEGGGVDPTRVFKVRDGKVTSHENKVRFELGLK